MFFRSDPTLSERRGKSSFLLLYFGFQFFFSLLLWLPVFYDFQRARGLSPAQIFTIQSIYFVSFCVFEIPAGYFADRLGRRLAMRLGAAMLAAVNLIPVFWGTSAAFLFFFLGVALARSLVTTAASAYLYDHLSTKSLLQEYKRAEGHARAYSLLGRVAGWAGIGFAMRLDFTSPFWLTALCALAAAFLAWKLPEDPMISREDSLSEEWSAIRVMKLALHEPFLILVMLEGILVFVLDRTLQIHLFQPVLHERSFALESYGIVMAGMTLVEAAGTYLSGLRRESERDAYSILAAIGVMALCMAGVGISKRIGTLIALGVYAVATGFVFPVQRKLVNDGIPDAKYRATFLAIESFMDRLVCAWVVSYLGAVVSGGKIMLFLEGAAIASWVACALFYGITRAVKPRAKWLEA